MLTYQGNIITKHTDVNNWLNPVPDSKYSWKLLNYPYSLDTYAYVGSRSDGAILTLRSWPSFVTPDWLDGQSRLELRGYPNAEYELPYAYGFTTYTDRLYIPYDIIYNKYYLFDMYGWYYCEGKIASVVHLDNGQITIFIEPRNTWNMNDTVFDITITPSNVVNDIAEYPQNNTNTITYSNNHQDTFVQDPTYKLLNFKCLIDMLHNKVYNCVQYAGDTYLPYDDIESITWNYCGTLSNTAINLINSDTARFAMRVKSGSFHTGITNWWQSGITWSNLTISGCCNSHLNIHYR